MCSIIQITNTRRWCSAGLEHPHDRSRVDCSIWHRPRTHPIALPPSLLVRRESKRDKLLQYAEWVWQATKGRENEHIDRAVEPTRTYVEAMDSGIRLPHYRLNAEAVDLIITRLETQGMTSLDEHRDVTLATSRRSQATTL